MMKLGRTKSALLLMVWKYILPKEDWLRNEVATGRDKDQRKIVWLEKNRRGEASQLPSTRARESIPFIVVCYGMLHAKRRLKSPALRVEDRLNIL
ncbi:MAG TPA: hypothetical protein VD966_07290 [Pyrinomonadaceae bacterium]|nr:hypothetical protein [Pyrinomonadaceae bacterium]